MINEKEIQKLFREDLGEKISDITNINSGLHNINFLITLKSSKQCVARVAGPSNIGKFKKQSVLMKMISQDVPVPNLIKFSRHDDPKTDILYFEFIDGDEVQFDKLNTYQIVALGKVVANIHTFHSEKFSPNLSEPPSEIGTINDYARAIFKNTVQEELNKYNHSLPSSEHRDLINAAIDTSIEMINEIPSETSPFSLLHTDIGYTNIIWKNNKPFIIDWDDAMYGDPADEVGYIFAINNSSDKFRQTFLESYVSSSQEETDSFIKRLPFYELKNRLFDVIWALSKLTPDSKTLKNQDSSKYLKMYEKRYKNLRQFLAKEQYRRD